MPRVFFSYSDYKGAGFFSLPVIGILIVIMIVIFLLTGRVGLPGPILWMLALGIAGLFATIGYRRKMEKRLGRKIKGDHELTSISSWMEASSKQEQSPVVAARSDMSPKEKADLARKNLEEIIKTHRTEGKEAAHKLIDQLIPLKEKKSGLVNVEYKIITAGGRENGPLDVDTIRELFGRNLITEDTLVFDPSLNQWTRLADVFNVSEWKRES